MVFPLWVGPDHDDRLGSFGRDQGRCAHTPRTVPRASRPGCAARCVEEQDREVAPAGPAGAASGCRRRGPRQGEGVAGRRRTRTARRRGPAAPGTAAMDRHALADRHGAIGVDQRALQMAEPVLDQERALTHLPQGHAPAELGQQTRPRWTRATADPRPRPTLPGTGRRSTRVSESASSPLANATCSESEAPTECRSDTRCSTATLETPKARDSFHDDWSHRATPRLDSRAQASSMTTNVCARPAPLALRMRARCACSQAVAQAISTPSADEV